MSDTTSMTDSPTRAAFAARFGDDQAEALIRAATSHDNDVHPNRGSDPFKWTLLIAIGSECFTHERYRPYHGITAPVDDIKAWIKAEANLATHDGDIDYLAAFCGWYDEYVVEAVQS